jgi:glycine/serine hydroxymethyltransferase
MKHLVNIVSKNFANSVDSLRRPLSEADSEIYQVILGEKKRQFTGINLIAS